MFKWNLLCFILCPLTLILSLGTEESLALSSLLTPVMYLYLLIRLLPPHTHILNFLISRPNSFSSLSLSSFVRWPFIALLWTHSSMFTSPVLGSPALGTAVEICFTRAEQRRRMTFFSLLGVFCLTQPRMLLVFTLLVHNQFGVHQDP